MKNKSAKHKSYNTFKFQRFSERISNIDVDIFHRVAHEYETQEEEGGCHFSRTITKWEVLNLTNSYANFKRDVKAHTVLTLTQLLHNKDAVVDVLLQHLKHKDVLCLQPLLELVVAVAKDLGNDFYTYYPAFFEILVDLLKTQDTDQLEWTFHCLAYLFKFLWRSLVKDIGTVFTALLPLLSDNYPEYINNFAAESFAFIARKVKDKRSFLKLILKAVKHNSESLFGCGKLLFEVINGVEGQFHSCADNFLPFLLESLLDSSLNQGVLFSIVEQIIHNVAENIQPQKCELLWQTLKTILAGLCEEWSSEEPNILIILKLMGQLIEFKGGRLLRDFEYVNSNICRILSYNVSKDVHLEAIKIAILLLTSTRVKVTQEQASNLIKKVTKLDEKEVVLYFVEKMPNYPSFEALILPTLLQMSIKENFEKSYLRVLTSVLLKKAPLCGAGINLQSWNKYTLDFGAQNSKVEHSFETLLSEDDFDSCISALIIVPHLKNTKRFSAILKEKFIAAAEDVNRRKKLFLLYNILEAMIHVSANDFYHDLKEFVFRNILQHCVNVKDVASLKLVDLFFTASSDLLEYDDLERLHVVLHVNFNSPFRELRLLTAHIYSLFENLKQFPEDFNVFSLCYKVEEVISGVDNYRDQLQMLEKFNFDKQQITCVKDTVFKFIPLRYLCGVLYINFKLLWEPVTKIIATLAQGFDYDAFWEVYWEILQAADHLVRDGGCNLEEEGLDSSFNAINELYVDMYKVDDKPDWTNHRLLLWSAVELFADVAERKSVDLSGAVLQFFENEFTNNNSDMAMKWNIKQMATSEAAMDIDDDIEDEIETNQIQPNVLAKKVSGNSKDNTKLLLKFLQILAKMQKPRLLSREPELCKLYFELLSHKHPLVQKAALDCVVSYKHKFVTPYQEHLYKLMDDKNFKNAIAAFNISKDDSVIIKEHRHKLMPIVMKILFSKMMAKTGLRTGGKHSGQFRRNLILRFLAGCEASEMITFIDMAFRHYKRYFDDNVVAMTRRIVQDVDLENYVPPKRLQSAVNLLNVVTNQFGSLMGMELLRYVLKVLLVIGAFLKAAYLKQCDVHGGYTSILKNLRGSCLKILERFFNNFEHFAWTIEEINAVFDVFVWPYLDKLNIEGIHSPTALLQLLCLWGKIPRYFPLLVKHEASDKDFYALPHMMSLFLNTKSHGSVTNLIMETVEKLLTLKSDEEELELAIDNQLPIQKHILDRLKVCDNINYGSCILLPHVSSVLEKLKRKLESKAKNLNKSELFILSRISELVWQSEESDAILELLLPLALKKCMFAGDETISQLITTIYNLLQNVEKPEKHLRNISPFFAYVSQSSSRKRLCDIMAVIAKQNESVKLLHEIVSELNSYDAKWVDQPDFQRRLDAFKGISSLDMDVDLGVILIYNCFYFITSEKDLSLRENASHCLKQDIPAFVNKRCNLQYVLDDTLLNLIRNGMRNKDYDIRNESLSILGTLARECADTHVVLKDLNKLTNKADLEVDFFENLTHLQTHRHSRALLKIVNVYKEQLSSPNVRTFTQFLLPIITHYFCTEKYANKHSLIDASIEALGLVCRLLPWHQYLSLLKYYLAKLRNRTDYQKQLVKITVKILDVFHYDLSKGEISELVQICKLDKDGKKDEAVEKGSSGEKEDAVEEDSVTGDESQLDEILDETTEEALVEEEVIHSVEVKAAEKIAVLCRSDALKVTKTIQTILLPQLHRTLAVLTQYESSHKVNRKQTAHDREEEDLLRVPISLAFVKLLQRLPKVILEANLPGILIKACTFLKSQLESVRRSARETLQNIMLTLGPQYLNVLLDAIVPLLSRGFQVHVLIFTLHAVLVSLKPMYKPNDIDIILAQILPLCQADLFGTLSEEKEVAKIASKTSEAKSTKSYDTFQVLAQYITNKCVMDLVLPIKNVLSNSHSYKTIFKAQECLRHISLGLLDNEYIAIDLLMAFTYGVASESIPQLLTPDKVKLSERESEKQSRMQTDCFIIPKAPVGRTSAVNTVKLSTKTNAHVLVEFGLRLCYFSLKRGKLDEENLRPLVDPFISIFTNYLKSKHLKISTVSLQCLQHSMKFNLPTLAENIKVITENIFEILHKYAAAGLGKGENFDLVVAAFKTMSVLVRDVKNYTIDSNQLKMLLLYVEQDLHDYERQAIAFGLLKSILARKLMVSEVHAVMDKVAELSITSEMSHVRLQCRQAFHHYLMDYPLRNKIDKHISFYLAQLNYELQFGRESALEMIQSLVATLPPVVLKQYSGTFFVTLGARLVNEEVPSCRKNVSDCLASMLTKLKKKDRDLLFDIVLSWLKDKKIAHKRLAAQVCGIFISVEKADFETRISPLVPLILRQFGLNDDDVAPGKFVRLKKDDESTNEQKERIKDHHLYQILQMLLKLCAQCPSFLKQTNHIENLSVHIQSLLSHSHEWVRLGATQFLGFVLSTLDINRLGELLLKQGQADGYLYSDPAATVKSLTLDLCAQLQPGAIKSELAEQVIKNLVFMARVLQKVPLDSPQVNLLWLVKRMRKIVNAEVVEDATSIVLRTEIFKWIAGVVTVIDFDLLKPVIQHLLAPLVREMITTEESNAPLRQLSKEVGNLFKRRLGIEEYTALISRIEQHLSVKRAERKRNRTQLAVTDPEMYAKKKIKSNEKKKEAKKKLHKNKGKRKVGKD